MRNFFPSIPLNIFAHITFGHYAANKLLFLKFEEIKIKCFIFQTFKIKQNFKKFHHFSVFFLLRDPWLVSAHDVPFEPSEGQLGSQLWKCKFLRFQPRLWWQHIWQMNTYKQPKKIIFVAKWDATDQISEDWLISDKTERIW